MGRVSRGVLLAWSVAAFACQAATPVPTDKLNYVGLWVAEREYVSIFSRGYLEYRKKLAGGLHDLSRGNVKFEADRLVLFFTDFRVDDPPALHDDGKWWMTLDGVRYRKVGPPVEYGKSSNWPPQLAD